MLDKPLYDSWKIRMELYMQNKEYGRMIPESVKHDPLDWPSIEVDGVTKLKKYAELFVFEKLQVYCDLKLQTSFFKESPQMSMLFKFVMDVKLGRDLHTTNFHQLKAYLEQHEIHVNEVRIIRERFTISVSSIWINSSHTTLLNYLSIYTSCNYLSDSTIDSGLAFPVFKQGDDPIDAINKMMSFLSTVATSRFPTTNNQLRNSSNPRQQATIHDGRGRQSSLTVGTSRTRANILGTGENNLGQQRVMKCFNCQGEGHMARQCPNPKRKRDATWFRDKVRLVEAHSIWEGHMARQCPKPKRKRDATWFRDKVLLIEAHRSGKVLNEEELEFLADTRVTEGPVTQTVITHNAAYQSDNLDAYDSDYDDFSTTKAVLMANLSSYRSYVLSEEPNSENTHNDMYLLETQNAAVQDTNSSTQQDSMILSVFEQLSNQVTNCNKVNKYNLIANESLLAELERYKEQVKLLEERQNVDLIKGKAIVKKFNIFKNESKEKEAKNIDKEIALEKKVREPDNIKAQQIRPMLYYGNVIAKETNVISIANSEETLKRQRDPMVLEKKLNIKPISYAELNRLSEDFGKRFVPQQELSDEQAFRLQTSHPNTD
ncbi:retrovirus-related pol polyprotein from transposon TNT 1-94 [Tanacetum coccineum]